MSLPSRQPCVSKSQKAGYIIALLLSPVFIIFAYFGHPQRGFVMMCVLGVFATVTYMKRHIAKKKYFIGVVTPFFIAEIFLALFVPMSEEHFPGILAMPFAIVNVILLLAILRLVEANIAPRDK